MAGIAGYGAYIPRYRIKAEEIAKVWGADPSIPLKGLLLQEKSVAAPDEDSITMSVEAARHAIARAGIPAAEIGAVYVGSESHPYAVKPSATTVAEAVGATPNVRCADIEFACKAGTEAVAICAALADSGRIEYGLGIGTDTAQGAPGDALEYATGAGAAAVLIGRKAGVAELLADCSFTTDTPDFWRRAEHRYPSHGGRFTGEPAYFRHTLGAGQMLLERAGLRAADIDYAVFHQPNGKFPARAAKMLGFRPEQIAPGLLSPRIGNAYSGSSLIGLCATLDIAKPGQRIMLCSYGSGAGSDAFLFKVTDAIDTVRGRAPLVKDIMTHRIQHIDYATYAKFTGMIVKAD
jgi:hydroxymethylglutaryl-CoA synthase